MIRSIFLVDDDDLATYLVGRIVKKISDIQSFSFRENGEEGINYLKSISDSAFPSIIFVDIDMPVMNGFEFLEAYKTEFFPYHPETQVYMMSSSNRKSDMLKSVSYSFVEGFFEKPLHQSKLEELIDHYHSVYS